jgi:hypothetical protein
MIKETKTIDMPKILQARMSEIYTRYHVCEMRRNKVYYKIRNGEIKTESELLAEMYTTLTREDKLRFNQEFWNTARGQYGRN